METKFYGKVTLLLKIVSVNQISIEKESRFFTNKLLSVKPSLIIVRHLMQIKPGYLKFMKIMTSQVNSC